MSKLKFFSFIKSNRMSIILSLVFIAAFMAGIAYAQGNGDTIHACTNPAGQLRVVESEEDCRPKETYLNWDAVGPQGPAGIKGDNGDPGDFSGYFESPNGQYYIIVDDRGICLQGPGIRIAIIGSDTFYGPGECYQ
jgi:hypothetical protein